MPDALVTPQINGTSVNVVISGKVLDNFIQGDCEKDNRGVYSGYGQEDLAAGTIRIIKPTILPVLTRRLGASVNGAGYSGSSISISNDEFNLEVKDVYDSNIDVPYNNLALCPQLKMDGWVSQIGKGIIVAKNGLCFATRYFQSFKKDLANALIHTFDKSSSTANIRDSFALCSVDLDKGDYSKGIDVFDENTRRFLIAADAFSYMVKNGAFIIGGSNYAQEMLSLGTVTPGDRPAALMDGYKGVAFSAPANMISNMKLAFADRMLGFPEGTIVACGFLGVESSSIANFFGIAENGVRTIPSPNGQGTRLQPNYRFGAATLFTKGNSWVMSSDYVNPFTFFTDAGLFPTITPSLIPATSRQAYKPSAVVTSPATGKFVVNVNEEVPGTETFESGAVTASANSKVASFAYIDDTAAYADVAAFLKAKAAGKTVVISTSLNTQISSTTGHYVSAIAVFSDGTLSAVGTVLVA